MNICTHTQWDLKRLKVYPTVWECVYVFKVNNERSIITEEKQNWWIFLEPLCLKKLILKLNYQFLHWTKCMGFFPQSCNFKWFYKPRINGRHLIGFCLHNASVVLAPMILTICRILLFVLFNSFIKASKPNLPFVNLKIKWGTWI